MSRIFDSLHPWTVPVAVGALALATVVYVRNSSSTPKEDTVKTALQESAPPNKATIAAFEELTALLPSDIVFTRQDQQLLRSVKSLWTSQAQDAIPAYVLRPSKSSELGIAMKVISKHVKDGLKFSLSSGGHSPNRNFANIHGGIMIDLARLNSIVISDDKKTVDVGPGARWGEVYTALEAHGLCCAGGRAHTVGVGGLALGGGLSFFSPKIGFVCDQILSFEIVLASGEIVTANATAHSDLAIALRGGGNNFGIVTKFTIYTFPQGKLWTGHTYHWSSKWPQMAQGYYDHMAHTSPTYDPAATCIEIHAYNQPIGANFALHSLHYSEPVQSAPPTFSWAMSIPRIWHTLKPRSMNEAATLIGDMNPHSVPGHFRTTTFEHNLPTMQHMYSLLDTYIKPQLKHVAGLSYAVSSQPLFPSATKYHAMNCMGVETDKTLNVVLLCASWNKAEDNRLVEDVTREAVRRIEEKAKEEGVYHRYKYANYAAGDQEVIEGYGEQRKEFLRGVARKVDPEGVFQVGCPGGFKLW